MRYVLYTSLVLVLFFILLFITAAGSALGNMDASDSLDMKNFIGIIVAAPFIINFIAYLLSFQALPANTKGFAVFLVSQVLLTAIFFLFVRFGIVG